MNCKKCGAPVVAGSNFCEVCGTKVDNGEFTQTPPPFQSQAGSGFQYDVNAGFSAKRIRKWFKGNKPKWPIVVVILGVVLKIIYQQNYFLAHSPVPIIVILIGAIAWVVTWMTVGTLQEVNQAWATYVNILSQRGLQKLNLIQDEVSLIEPIVLVGCGKKPNDSYVTSKAEALAKQNIFKVLFQKLIGTFKHEYDPEVRYRIDEQNFLHSMLLQVSVYMFSGNQVFVYVGNIDISTGLIYQESTSEVFFQDIEGLNFEQEIIKIYNEHKKNRENKVMETFVLYLAGCKLSSSVLLEANDMSVVENQLSGMRNLVRDKKNVE